MVTPYQGNELIEQEFELTSNFSPVNALVFPDF